MVFLHGYGQSRMGWMTTPDGREGWSDMFLRKGHSVYLIDEPHRGEAGSTSVKGEISTKTLEQRWYTQFRIGKWVEGKSVANEGSQFPTDAVIDEVYARTGKDSILVTHSQGGRAGYAVAQYTKHLAAIVAIEPGNSPAKGDADYDALLKQKIPATNMWKNMRQTSYDFEKAYKADGGDATVIDLPKEGITGNDHFMFQDKNNDVIANHIEKWIRYHVR